MDPAHTTIAMPPTTSAVVVFPFNAADKTFDSSFYSPNLTDGRVSFEEISQFLAEIEALKPTAASQSGCGACRLICVVLLVVLWTAKLSLQSHMVTDITPFVVTIVIVIVLAVIFLIVLASKGDKDSKAKCQAVVERYNKTLASRELRWYLPVSFPQWVELWKDYPQNQNQNQGIIMPPVNQQPYPIGQNYGMPNQNYQGQVNNNMYNPPSQF